MNTYCITMSGSRIFVCTSSKINHFLHYKNENFALCPHEKMPSIYSTNT